MDVGSSGTVASDIRFAILKSLGEAGVEIPYPQRELRWRDSESAETEKKPAAPRRKRSS
jgi:small-conductance mechanosensitive channel